MVHYAEHGARVLTGEHLLLTRRQRRRRCRRRRGLDRGVRLLRRPLHRPVNGRRPGLDGGGGRLLRSSGYPIDGRRPDELDDDRPEPDHVAAGRMPGRRHQVRVVRLAARVPGAVRLERNAPGRGPATAVVRLARVRAEHADRHQTDVQRMVGPLFEHVRVHRQHAVGAPPRDDGPGPADRVTVQRRGAVQRDHHGRALLADHAG